MKQTLTLAVFSMLWRASLQGVAGPVLAVVIMVATHTTNAVEMVVAPPISESRFGVTVPNGWRLGAGWMLTEGGAATEKSSEANWELDLPQRALLEMIFILPTASALENGVSASLRVGREGDAISVITAQAQFGKLDYKTTLCGTGEDGKKVRVSADGKALLSMLRRPAMEQADKQGWASQSVSLGIMLDNEQCRLLLNGHRCGQVPIVGLAQRRVSIVCDGVVLTAVRLLPATDDHYVALTGSALAMKNGGANGEPVKGVPTTTRHSVLLKIKGVPFVVQGADKGLLTTMDVAVEKWKAEKRKEGSGMPVVHLPAGRYSAAHLLVHVGDHSREKTPALGTGLRIPNANGGNLKNVYVGDVPVRSNDKGVTVTAVPQLGKRWFLAQIPLNPAALPSSGAVLYLTRPWQNGGVPRPVGKPSALRIAAVTMQTAGIKLSVDGNGLGNVFCQSDVPYLSATLRNVTSEAVSVKVQMQLIPFERRAATRAMTMALAPGEQKTVNALAAPIRQVGHYKVRVVADAGTAGRIEHRTNVALLAPNTRKMQNSPFGIWPKLSGDGATPKQRAYLWEKAGIGYLHKRHTYTHRLFGGRGHKKIVDDATAEQIARKMGPEVRVAMFGWERKWEGKGAFDVTYKFPRVIWEGQPEKLSSQVNAKIDGVAEELRRFAKALRKLRPQIKISLGNTGVNWVTFLLERGIRHPDHFDYFGTEEGLFDKAPEEPADAVGNINWWTQAICEHYGFKNVPLFHSESAYFGSGIGFSRLTERTQAGYYVRTFLLGFPYKSIFGMSGALVDSSNNYIYSIWGTAGYCNQAPECSPKLSYVVFATLTQQLDEMKYEGKLDTGTTSVYALRFRHNDGTPLCLLWNLRGRRNVTTRLAVSGEPQVVDALNRPVQATATEDGLPLTLSDLPTYVRGVTITAIELGANVPMALPDRVLLDPLDGLDDWTMDTARDEAFEKPAKWRGVPKAKGNFEVVAKPLSTRPTGIQTDRCIGFRQRPLPGTHGLIPRYVVLRAKPGKEIPVVAGTTRLGVWVHGNSTWARVYLGGTSTNGGAFLTPCDKGDNFDGWRFLQTDYLGDKVHRGTVKIDRIVVTMPEHQVYVDDLMPTQSPTLAIGGIYAVSTKPPPINYLPW